MGAVGGEYAGGGAAEFRGGGMCGRGIRGTGAWGGAEGGGR